MYKIIQELKEKLKSESWDNNELFFALRELAGITEELITLVEKNEKKK